MTTNEITAAKIEFKLDLVAAGLIVSDHVPERITPPIVIINNGSPYLQPASIGKEYTLTLELICVAATATNKMASERLDALLEQVINAMPGYARMLSAGQPYNLQTNNTEYLAVSVQTDLQITI
jgi:hypothetical protein